MTEHIDIPLDVIDELIMKTLAGKNSEVLGSLKAIRDLITNPDIRSHFEINALNLIHYQNIRIEELENAAKQYAHDVMANSFSEVGGFTTHFNEWLQTSRARYKELVKDYIKR